LRNFAIWRFVGGFLGIQYDAAWRIVGRIRRFFSYTESMTSQEVRHRVYLSFQCRYGWHCQFLEQDLKTPLPRKLHFASSDKVVELVERGGGLSNLESRQALDQAIEIGRGGVFLNLTEEQYARLKTLCS
jgi:hypothetical protein